MSNNIAKFRFSGYQVLKSNISINEPSTISENLEIKFKRSSGINEKEYKYKLDLEVTIEDENKSLFIEVICNGFFEFDKDITDEERSIFFNTSAPAILFPYLRAYISTLTTLSGIQPVTLPTINLSSGAIQQN